jgi:hypothetical protein
VEEINKMGEKENFNMGNERYTERAIIITVEKKRMIGTECS